MLNIFRKRNAPIPLYSKNKWHCSESYFKRKTQTLLFSPENNDSVSYCKYKKLVVHVQCPTFMNVLGCRNVSLIILNTQSESYRHKLIFRVHAT